MKGIHLIPLLGCGAVGVVLMLPGRHEDVSPQATKRSRAREVLPASAFWDLAVVPEPEAFREPSAAVVATPGLFPIDHRKEVIKLIKEGNQDRLNHAVADWFDAEPEAVSDWLGRQESLEALQSAVGMIAGKIARDGDPLLGLEWAKLLQQGQERDQVFFDIYALAARGWRFSEEELRAAPLPSEKLEVLLSGAAGD